MNNMQANLGIVHEKIIALYIYKKCGKWIQCWLITIGFTARFWNFHSTSPICAKFLHSTFFLRPSEPDKFLKALVRWNFRTNDCLKSLVGFITCGQLQ